MNTLTGMIPTGEQTHVSNSLFEILSYNAHVFNIYMLDKERLLFLWKRCTTKTETPDEYGLENYYEDIMKEYNNNPTYVMFVIFELMTPSEKTDTGLKSWEEYVEYSFKYMMNTKCEEVKECLNLFDQVRYQTKHDDSQLMEEKIFQNNIFRKYVLSRLWMSLYNMYTSLHYEMKHLQHIYIAINVAEIRKYEQMWNSLQKQCKVDHIPEDFWEWLSEDRIKSYLLNHPHQLSVDNSTKSQLIKIIQQVIDVPSEQVLSFEILDNRIRKLNEKLKPDVINKIKNECSIFDNHEQLMKVFTIDECKELITYFSKRTDFSEKSQMYEELYLCIYKNNVLEYTKHKRNYIQKRLIENVLVNSNLLEFSSENVPHTSLNEQQMYDTVADFILPGDIKNQWFINVYHSFNDPNPFNLFWKFKCSNFFAKDCIEYAQCIMTPVEHWKTLSNTFSTFNNIGINIFQQYNVKCCVIKIKHEYKSSYMVPSTYSHLLKQLISTERLNRTPRALHILHTILKNGISNLSILYRYTKNVYNDNEVHELV